MFEDHPDAFLRLPRLVGPVVKIRDVMGRLVAVDVAADDAFAGDVLGLGKKRIRQVHREKLVEMLRQTSACRPSS